MKKEFELLMHNPEAYHELSDDELREFNGFHRSTFVDRIVNAMIENRNSVPSVLPDDTFQRSLAHLSKPNSKKQLQFIIKLTLDRFDEWEKERKTNPSAAFFKRDGLLTDIMIAALNKTDKAALERHRTFLQGNVNEPVPFSINPDLFSLLSLMRHQIEQEHPGQGNEFIEQAVQPLYESVLIPAGQENSPSFQKFKESFSERFEQAGYSNEDIKWCKDNSIGEKIEKEQVWMDRNLPRMAQDCMSAVKADPFREAIVSIDSELNATKWATSSTAFFVGNPVPKELAPIKTMIKAFLDSSSDDYKDCYSNIEKEVQAINRDKLPKNISDFCEKITRGEHLRQEEGPKPS
jgi:hypothetical protein